MQVLLQSKYRYGGSYQYCTVEIPTEMEFTGTFQNIYNAQIVLDFQTFETVCLSRTLSDKCFIFSSEFQNSWDNQL